VGRDWVLSHMSVAELDQWALTHHWGATRRAQLELLLGSYAIAYPDRELCRLWAEVCDGARRNGRPIECADAWIASTALALNAGLVTHNPADYLGVNGLTVFSEATT
jgi:predicted nucleic acid-binding protein